MDVGFFLLRRSTKQTWSRIAVIGVAVALGVTVVLCLFAGLHALDERGERTAWRKSAIDGASAVPVAGVDPLLWSTGSTTNLNVIGNERIVTISLARTGSNTPAIPYLAHVPDEGEYYVSAALKQHMESLPPDQLTQRFEGRMAGVLPEQLVSSPEELVVVRGMSQPEKTADRPGAGPQKVYRISTDSSDGFSILTQSMLIIGAFGVFFPIVMLVAVATRLGSVQREQQFAALRLIGATKRGVTYVSSAETLVSSMIGVLMAIPLFMVIQPFLHTITIFGDTFYAEDVTIGLTTMVLVFLSVLLFTFAANWWGLRRVRMTPLGVARRVRTMSPRARRVVPLVVGVGMSGAVLGVNPQWASEHSMIISFAVIGGFVMTTIGLIIAGPWILKMIATIYGRLARSAEGLLVARRLQHFSPEIFRSVSGVIIVLFMGSFYLTSISAADSLLALRTNPAQQLYDGVVFVWPGADAKHAGASLDTIGAALQGEAGVSSVLRAKSAPDRPGELYMSCKDITAITAQPCADEQQLRRVPRSPVFVEGAVKPELSQRMYDTGTGLPTGGLFVVARGTPDMIEKVRTISAQTSEPANVTSIGYIQSFRGTSIYADFAWLAYVGIGITVIIASISLAVSTIAGLLERRRVFYLLRLSGLPLKSLKKIVVIESLTALLSISVLSSALGVLMAKFSLEALSSSVRAVAPPMLYYAVVAGALVFSLLVIAALLPAIQSMTRPDQNREE